MSDVKGWASLSRGPGVEGHAQIAKVGVGVGGSMGLKRGVSMRGFNSGARGAGMFKELVSWGLAMSFLGATLVGCGGGGGGGSSSEADLDGVRIVHASIDSAPLVLAGDAQSVPFAQFGKRFWPSTGGVSQVLQLQSTLSNQVVASVDVSSSALGERLSEQLGKRVGRYAIFVSGLSENGALKAQVVEEPTGVSVASSIVVDVFNGVAGAGTLRVSVVSSEKQANGGDTGGVNANGGTTSTDIAEGAHGGGLVIGPRGSDEAAAGPRVVTISAQTLTTSGMGATGDSGALNPTAKIYEESFTLEPGARYTLLLTGQPGYLVVGKLAKK